MTKTVAKAMTAMSALLDHNKAASVRLAVKRALMPYVIEQETQDSLTDNYLADMPIEQLQRWKRSRMYRGEVFPLWLDLTARADTLKL